MTAVAVIPRVVLTLDGQRLEPATVATLAAVRVEQRMGSPAQCELSFICPSTQTPPLESMTPGHRLTVDLEDGRGRLFAGDVTAVEYQYQGDRTSVVHVRAYDSTHRLRKRQSVRSFTSVTPGDVLREVAGPAGISAEVRADGPARSRVTQFEQSDLGLVQELAAASGLLLVTDGEAVVMMAPDDPVDVVELELGAELLEVGFELNAHHAAGRVRALGWVPATVRITQEDVRESRRSPLATPAFDVDEVGGTEDRWLVDLVTVSDQARELARAELERRQTTTLVVRGVAEGDPRLRPGVAVDVSGVQEALAGRYLVTSATHTIDGLGYLTRISTDPPIDRRPRRQTRVTVGTVISVDDPDAAGRVRVSLPGYNDVETEWMQVVLPAGSSTGGLIALPDVGDSVLVVLPDGDPSQGVVLGGLAGESGPHDSGVVGGAVQRFMFHTAGGHRLVFDDSSSSLRVEDPSGSYIDMTPERMRLHSAVDLDIEAPGKRVVISADRVDFRRR